jgi:hypothetical protein
MAKRKAEANTDWARIRALSDDEIERMANDDAENPASKAADWADAMIGLPKFDATGRPDNKPFSPGAKTTK